MKKTLKRLAACAVISCLAQSTVYGASLQLTYDGQVHDYNQKDITLYVNNEQVESSIMPAIEIGGYVFVPIREVFDAMHATVQWKQAEQKVYIESDDGKLIVLDVNSTEAFVNGETKQMDISAKVINQKVMVPIRFISETLGFNVNWIENSRSVYINKRTISSETNTSTGNNSGINTSTSNNSGNTYISSNLGENSSLSQALPILDYDTLTGSIVISSKLGISAQDISVQDLTMKRKLVFNISNCDLSQVTAGSWSGSLGHLRGVTITKGSNNMQIIVKTDTVCAEKISESNGMVAIKFVKPREKYNKIIVLDPGHGGDDNGTSAAGYYEKDLTLSYGRALYSVLANDPDIKVYTTRNEDLYGGNEGATAGKQYPSLEMRVNMANEIDPDLYISIHINSYGEAPNGVETYYYEVASDNRGKVFAQMVQNALVNEFGMNDRHIKTADYFVIKNTNDPAILIETGFITNAKDRAILTSSTYSSRFAQAVYGCILNYYAKGLNK